MLFKYTEVRSVLNTPVSQRRLIGILRLAMATLSYSPKFQ